jgi:hypothetical protein
MSGSPHMSRRVQIVFVGMLCVVSRVAEAQYAFPEPYQGTPSRELLESGREVELNWSLLGLYDGNNAPDAPEPTVVAQPQLGTYGTAAATLAYTTSSRRRAFGASGTATGNYYPTFRNVSDVGGTGDVNVALPFGRGAKLSASQVVRFQPYYQFDFIAPIDRVEFSATDRDLVLKLASRGADGRIEFADKLGRRSTLSVSYSYRYTEWSLAPGAFWWNAANGRLAYKLTRNAALRLGYGYGHVADDLAAGTSQLRTNTADVGIDWTPPRRARRQPTITASSGTSFINDRRASYNRLLANAAVAQPLGGSWTARGAYRRGFQFVEGFSGPLYADVAHVQVVARAAKRTEFSVGADYSRGQLGLISTGHRYVAHSATAGVRIALTQLLSMDAQYVRYYYEFDPEATLPFNVSHRLARQGIRIGVAGSVPLSRKRTPGTPVPPAD